MKKFTVVLLVVVGALAAEADLATAEREAYAYFASRTNTLTLSQRMRERQYLRHGERIRKPLSGKGWIAVCDCQKRVNAESILSNAVEYLVRETRAYIRFRRAEAVTLGSADKTLAALGANAAVFLVDDTTLSMPMLIAPEQRWALVNVSRLFEGATSEQMIRRVKAETLRAFAMLCGGGGACSQVGSPMRPVISVKDLDRVSMTRLPPQTLDKMEQQLRSFGIQPFVEMTYLEAVREGWAPPPVTPYQKFMWNKVHQLPTEPIKILPEKVKQR